jgi:primary-amine oxidase
VTVVNYEYAVYWNFYQDGTISFDMKATGELSTNLISSPHTGPVRHGTTVAENISGQFHQHIFAMRLDTIFDGPKNTVSTVDVVPLEAPAGSSENPYGQGFTVKETVLKTTEKGKTDVCAQTSRVWKISNSASINEVTKEPVAWKLIPSGSCGLLAKPGSYVWNKARFAQHSLWVTLYDEDQRFPSGFYILNQSEENNGISEWTKNEKDIENQDIVLWHVFGLTHVPRIEDFPIMSME